VRPGRHVLATLLGASLCFALAFPTGAQQPVPPTPPQPPVPPTAPLPPEPTALPLPPPGLETVEPPVPLFGPYTRPPGEAPGQVRTPPPYLGKGRFAPSSEGQSDLLALTPSLAIDEIYTDNVFLDNSFKRADLITNFTPGLLLTLRTPDFGASLGYVFTSQLYVNETQLDDVQARWAASFASYYRFSPQLKLNLSGGYLEDNTATASGIPGISTGRTTSRNAIATPALSWQVDPVTTVQLVASWLQQRFDQDQFVNVPLAGYDTYTFGPSVSRGITSTLTGTFQYQFLYQNSQMPGEDAAYHLILPGVSYQITPSLSGTLSLGPQIVTKGETGVTLALQLGLAQGFSWGGLGLNFSRSEAPTGGLGGTAETITGSLGATITNVLLRNLTLGLGLSFTSIGGNDQIGSTDSITFSALATYPMTPWMVAFFGYSYFRQRTSGTALNAIDNNVVSAGVQLFHPLRLQ
jgi:hypothetical protein